MARTNRAYGAARFARSQSAGYMIPGHCWQRKVAGAPGSPAARAPSRYGTRVLVRFHPAAGDEAKLIETDLPRLLRPW